MTEERRLEITENYRAITENIRSAFALRPEGCGGVRILAATKHVPPEEIAFAVRELGITLAGENRTDELLDKINGSESPYLGAELHFIGTLQTRKVRDIVGKVSMIESVDSYKLACEIDRRSRELGLKTEVLIEINSGREASKSGIMPEEFDALADEITAMEGLVLRGGMTMGPKCENFNEYRKIFKETYNKILDFSRKKSHNIKESSMEVQYAETEKCESVRDSCNFAQSLRTGTDILNLHAASAMDFPLVSMGMSDSYGAAVAEGAGIVRIGSALFGARK